MARARHSIFSAHPTWQWLSLAAVALVAAVLAVVAVGSQSRSDASQVAATYTPAPAPTQDPGTFALFIGDSYTAPEKSWAQAFSAEQGWTYRNVAVGGSGVINGRDNERYGAQPDREPNFKPDVVVISGGRNDSYFTAEEIGAGLDQLFSDLATRYPEAKVIMMSPWWDDDLRPVEFDATYATYEAAAARAGVPFLATGQPLEGHPDFVVEDGVHPNEKGQAALAAAAIAAFQNAGITVD